MIIGINFTGDPDDALYRLEVLRKRGRLPLSRTIKYDGVHKRTIRLKGITDSMTEATAMASQADNGRRLIYAVKGQHGLIGLLHWIITNRNRRNP